MLSSGTADRRHSRVCFTAASSAVLEAGWAKRSAGLPGLSRRLRIDLTCRQGHTCTVCAGLSNPVGCWHRVCGVLLCVEWFILSGVWRKPRTSVCLPGTSACLHMLPQ
jgi:hypothetical protein